MTTKTVAITSGTTWALPSDAYGATAQIICWGAGANGGSGGVLGGVGGISGCVASISGYTLPGSGSVSIQIPAGNSSSACWFNSSATVQASSKSTSTASCVGTTKVGGSAGGGICGCQLGGGGGGGAPGLSSPGGAGSEGRFSCCTNFGGAGGVAGSPSYTATAGEHMVLAAAAPVATRRPSASRVLITVAVVAAAVPFVAGMLAALAHRV